MEKVELENMGIELCHSLLERDYMGIAARFGYAISFDRAPQDAIKEDFEDSIRQAGGALELSKFNVIVKSFPSGTPGFIDLIECWFSFPNANQEVLAEIIHNESGCYLEQISCMA